MSQENKSLVEIAREEQEKERLLAAEMTNEKSIIMFIMII